MNCKLISLLPITTFLKHHLPIKHNFLESESAAIYLSSTLRSLGLSLIGIFFPLYLYQMDFFISFHPVEHVSSLLTIPFFYLFESLTVVLTIVLFMDFIYSKLHFKKMLLLSNLVIVAALLLAYQLYENQFLFFIIPVLFGLAIVLYWIPYHLFFVENNSEKGGRYGKKLGLSSFFNLSVNAIGPLVGGLIIAAAGFGALFIIASLILLGSGFPILLEITEGDHKLDSPKSILKDYLFNKEFKFVSLSFFGASLDFVSFNFFWPVVLLLVLDDFAKIGLLTFVTLVSSAIATILVGKMIDTDKAKQLLVHKIGTFFSATLHLSRVFVFNPVSAFAVDLMDKLNYSLFDMPFTAKTYELARKDKDDADFLVYREVSLHLFRLVSIFLVFFLIYNFSESWRFVFILSAISVFLMFLINLGHVKK